MTLQSAILTRKPEIARVLLLIFAFTAWSITAPANIAVALLVALFLTEIPSHWGQLRREPAFLLLMGVLIITSLLALRATWLFPTIAQEQWQAVSAWVAPFLFIVPAWWLRQDPRQVWPLLGAAALGLGFGILRKSDWSLAPQFVDGLRYDFGFAALGVAFLASVTLVGLLLFRARITGLRLAGRPQPLLGWILWCVGVGLLLAVLIITQSRGAALGLAIAAILYGVLQGLTRRRQGGATRPESRRPLAAVALVIALSTLLLLTSKDRPLEDWRLTTGGPTAAVNYTGSFMIRLNLHRVGLTAFAQGPLLGFGPGTSTTEFLVPEQVIRVSAYHQAHAPQASHMHSVALEVLARFGLVGALIALILGWVLWRAYHRLWTDARVAPDLRVFLTLGGALLLFFSLYDFRLVNLDQRFFCILFLGVLYCFQLGPPEGTNDQGVDHC